MKEKFIIIDGNAILHRSYHALPPLKTKKGEMVNAIYGFMMILIKVLHEIKPKYIAVTFDKAAPTFRHKMYEPYKGTRVKVDGIEELYKQMPKLKEIISAFNIPIYELDGFEADDIIGTIARKINIGNNMPYNQEIETIIVTGDLDTLQLVNENTKVYTLKKGLSESIVYDKKEVEERFGGLTPEQMVDYKSLRGDPSDNIPGVKGIGEKGAIDLLKVFRTLENLYKEISSANAEKLVAGKKISPKVLKALIEHKEDALLSKRLATIDKNAPINFRFDDIVWKGFDQKKILELFQEMEFKSLMSRLGDLALVEKTKKEDIVPCHNGNYKLIESEDDFSELIKNLTIQSQIAIDTETTSIDAMRAELLGISFSWKEGESYYLESSKFKSQSLKIFELKNILENEDIKKCGHNIKYDIEILAKEGINVRGVNFDTMIAAYLLNPGERNYGLDNLAFSEFGYQMTPITDLIGKGRKQINMAEVPVDKVCKYSCEDADYTFRLMRRLSSKLEKHKSIKVFEEIEMPLTPVLVEMEQYGVKIDENFLKELHNDFEERKNKIEQKVFSIAGEKFNIASPLQLKEILFDKLKISSKGIRKGKTGLSTAAPELEKMRHLHPIIECIFEYRELSKLISTYVDALPELVNPKTGRVHTSFNQAITATGRLSSSNPNLQNIPIRTELGAKIRKAFIAEKSYKMMSADYSQVELRIIASLANDKKMIEAFRNGADIHTTTAAEIFKVKPEDVTSRMRRQAKAINFGIIYGMGAHGLAESADISYAEAQMFIEEYFNLYKDIKIYLDNILEGARTNGYVETYFGRRRYLPEIASQAPFVRSTAERMAVNHPVQGTAADLMKLAMINLQRKLKSSGLDIKMILQIHDELLFEVKESHIETAKSIIKYEMENAAKLEVPLKVDIGVGENWGEI